ncbi:DUF5666 domain-containing protein, partial [Kineosporia sp. R_H_3]|uniref:DUF5666 domain-containing protein n=1 Tax=Kineosporia sp. R_H_3 TaxID=1961848 RepID=UPI001E62C68E
DRSGGPAGPVSWMEADLGDGSGPSPAAPARRRPGMVVAAAVGAGALLLGGVAVGQAFGATSDTTSLTSQSRQGQPGQMGQGGPGQQGGTTDQLGGTTQQQDGGRGGTGGGPPGTDDGTMVVGRVSGVSGSTLTLDSRSGTVTVTTTSSTTVDGTVGGDLSTLATGTLVFVQGTQSSDGAWTATAVSTTPDGGTGGGMGGPPGQDQQGGTAQQGTTGTTT